jgi:hypothetical protein
LWVEVEAAPLEEMETMERSNSLTPALEVTRESVLMFVPRMTGSETTRKEGQEEREEVRCVSSGGEGGEAPAELRVSEVVVEVAHRAEFSLARAECFERSMWSKRRNMESPLHYGSKAKLTNPPLLTQPSPAVRVSG